MQWDAHQWKLEKLTKVEICRYWYILEIWKILLAGIIPERKRKVMIYCLCLCDNIGLGPIAFSEHTKVTKRPAPSEEVAMHTRCRDDNNYSVRAYDYEQVTCAWPLHALARVGKYSHESGDFNTATMTKPWYGTLFLICTFWADGYGNYLLICGKVYFGFFVYICSILLCYKQAGLTFSV